MTYFLSDTELRELKDLAWYQRNKKRIREVCKSKIKYKTVEEAETAAVECSKKYNEQFRAYECLKRAGKKHWHLTTH